MTLYGEPTVWLEQFPQDRPTEIHCDHLELRYTGEVIRARSWTPSWGDSLDRDLYFRIVLMNRRRGNLRPRISDPRIAVCFPGAGLSRRHSAFVNELAGIRETKAIYLGSSDSDADLIRTTLRRREERLEQELLGEESVRYSQGAVVNGSANALDPAGVFSGIDPNEWFQRLAGDLLGQAYPVLPVNTSDLRRAVTPEDPLELHRSIFDHPGADSGPLSTLGPALGISSHSSPEEFDPSGCHVFELLRQWLTQQPDPAELQAANHYLAHKVSLTHPLAQLYLLSFVNRESPSVEIKLESRDGVSTVSGKPLLTRRLTGDLIPSLRFHSEMFENGGRIGSESGVEWEDTLHHLSLLSPNLAAHSQSGDMATAEAVLAHDIDSLTQDVSRSHGLLAQLYQANGEYEFAGLAEALERLASILGVASAGYKEVYQRIRSLYPDLRSMENDVSEMRRMAEIGEILPEMLVHRSYLDGAEISPSAMPSLWVDRQGLRATLSLTGLTHPPGTDWESLTQDLDRFKSSYTAAYRDHHTRLYQALPAYRRDLEAARRNSRALTLLNTIPELLGREGPELAESLGTLDVGPACDVESDRLQLEDRPICQSCQITLEQTLPVDELRRIGSAIDSALAIQNEKLSNLLVGKIMQNAGDPRLDDFIRIVQTSDLSALSNTLNQDMVDFIRRLLA